MCPSQSLSGSGTFRSADRARCRQESVMSGSRRRATEDRRTEEMVSVLSSVMFSWMVVMVVLRWKGEMERL